MLHFELLRWTTAPPVSFWSHRLETLIWVDGSLWLIAGHGIRRRFCAFTPNNVNTDVNPLSAASEQQPTASELKRQVQPGKPCSLTYSLFFFWRKSNYVSLSSEWMKPLHFHTESRKEAESFNTAKLPRSAVPLSHQHFLKSVRPTWRNRRTTIITPASFTISNFLLARIIFFVLGTNFNLEWNILHVHIVSLYEK